MALHLLDADAAIDYTRVVPASVALIDGVRLQGHDLCISNVVVAELYTNLLPRERPRAEELVSRCRYLPMGMEAAIKAGQWRFDYARRGVTLAVSDCLIAATAWEYDATLVTGNLRHFPMDEISILPLPRVR